MYSTRRRNDGNNKQYYYLCWGRACARRRPLDRGALRRGWRSRKHGRERRERERYDYNVIRAGSCAVAARPVLPTTAKKTTLGDWSPHVRRNNTMYWIINYNNAGSCRWIMIKYKYKSNLSRWRQVVRDIVIDDYKKYGGTMALVCIGVSFTQNTGNRSSIILGWVADI